VSLDEEIASFERRTHPVKLHDWCGSGTIFLSLCDLRCVFCQNRDFYVNIKGQYRPEYEVGQIAGEGLAGQYAEIDRRPAGEELERAPRHTGSTVAPPVPASMGTDEDHAAWTSLVPPGRLRGGDDRPRRRPSTW
jgi:hypothetical protein